MLRRECTSFKKVYNFVQYGAVVGDTNVRILNNDLKINEEFPGRYGTRNPQTSQYFEQGSEIKC